MHVCFHVSHGIYILVLLLTELNSIAFKKRISSQSSLHIVAPVASFILEFPVFCVCFFKFQIGKT